MQTPRWFLGIRLGLLAVGGLAGCDTPLPEVKEMAKAETSLASEQDRQRGEEIARRELDWRNGAIVYQVIVDRFAPSADLDAKRALYAAPRRLRKWSESPKRGEFLPAAKVWTHEIEFWGGDLKSLRSKLDYVEGLGVTVLYLNPIHKAFTNHKYDALDYFEVSEEYGTRQDVKALAADLHRRGMKLVLDGVFNHMGRSAAWFKEAMAGDASPKRDWFFIGPDYEKGYRAWAGVANLPELRIENPAVQARIYGDPDSVVQGYLRDGVDGWRLDVAFDLGFVYLDGLTRAAHSAKPGSLVIGEIWNYPSEWAPAVDAIMNFHAGELIKHFVRGEVSGGQAGRMLDVMVADAGLETILKAWLVLDNHDLPRLRTQLKKRWREQMAQVLQFTVPGSPNLYYGVELGMEGGWDPEMRGPMPWDKVDKNPPSLQWVRKLVAMRCNSRALRVGDFLVLPSDTLLAFMRRTDRVDETTVVVANASDKPATEVISLREPKLMNFTKMKDALSDAEVQPKSGVVRVTVPAHTAWVLQPVIDRTAEYSPYKRVQ